MTAEDQARILRRLKQIAPLLYLYALVWINLHICRDFFRNTTAPSNSMHGFWAAIAKWADGAWFHASWWPYWDNGIPFELTYAPGVPFLTHVIAGARHISTLLAFNIVSGSVYLLAPITLFAMGWWMTGAPGYAFIAGLVYSLTAPTQLLAPDQKFDGWSFLDARRLFLLADWDDTPHLAALTLLPLIILFLSLSIRKRRAGYYAAAVICIALATLCSAFGPTDTAMAALCLLLVLHRERLGFNIALIAGIGVFAWALTAPFMSPAVLAAIRQSSNTDGTGWNSGSWIALALTALGFAVLWYCVRRRTSDWRIQFFALFAWLASSVPTIAEHRHLQFLPQPGRYKFEMEMALVLVAVFALRPLVDRLPVPVRAGLLLVILVLANWQIGEYRAFAKRELAPRDPASMIESRASTWAAQNLPDTRVFAPGSIAMWGNFFTPAQQFSGSSWSMAYNQVQQHASYGIQGEKDPRVPLLWLKAFGVGAVCVPGPKSPEYWKPVRYTEKFDGLPVLWSEEDTTIYEVPRRSNSFAHVVPESAIVKVPIRENYEVAKVEPYVAALDDSALPEARLRWEGNNRFLVDMPQDSGHALSIQVSWHPGWHARVNGKPLTVAKDGLGLMYLKPDCAGPCEIQMDYDGGWQLRILRWLSFVAAAVLAGGLLSSGARSIRARVLSASSAPAPSRG